MPEMKTNDTPGILFFLCHTKKLTMKKRCSENLDMLRKLVAKSSAGARGLYAAFSTSLTANTGDSAARPSSMIPPVGLEEDLHNIVGRFKRRSTGTPKSEIESRIFFIFEDKKM